jgi:hypothetical protein
MTTPDELETLAASVRKNLHWAVFALGALALILVIDLQLKRSIGRQAVTVARRLADLDTTLARETQRLVADVKEATGERQPVDAPAHDGDHPCGCGGDDVDGSAGVAAGSGPPRGARQKPPARRGPRPQDRAPGDG